MLPEPVPLTWDGWLVVVAYVIRLPLAVVCLPPDRMSGTRSGRTPRLNRFCTPAQAGGVGRCDWARFTKCRGTRVARHCGAVTNYIGTVGDSYGFHVSSAVPLAMVAAAALIAIVYGFMLVIPRNDDEHDGHENLPRNAPKP